MNGNVHKVIPVRATVVDKAAPEARQTPFVQTFQYKEKELTEIVLEKFLQQKTEKAKKIASSAAI